MSGRQKSIGVLTAALAGAAFLALAPGPARADVRLLWESTYYDTGDLLGYDVQASASGDIYLAGSMYADQAGGSNSEAILLKLNRYGAPDWSRTLAASTSPSAEAAARAVALHPSGDLIVGGQTYSGPTTGLDAWVARITPDGDYVWTTVMNGTMNDEDSFESLAVNPVTGEVFAAGRQTRCANSQLWLVKVNQDTGAQECTYTLIPDAFCRPGSAFDVAVDSATGAVYVAGYMTTGTQGLDAWVGKFAGSCGLTPLWSVTLNGALSSTDYGGGIAVDSAGNPVMVGSQAVAARHLDAWVAKLNPADGTQVWSLTLDGGEGDDDEARGCAAGPGGELYVAGYVDRRHTGSFSDIWLGAVSALGATVWDFDRDFGDTDSARRVRRDAAGNLYVIGTVYSLDDNKLKIYLGIYGASLPWTGLGLSGTTAPFAAPNPFRPGSAGIYGGPAITFANLPPGAAVRIFSLSGARIAELADTDGDGVVVWSPVENAGGEPLASGVYIFVVESTTGSISRGKVVVIR